MLSPFDEGRFYAAVHFGGAGADNPYTREIDELEKKLNKLDPRKGYPPDAQGFSYYDERYDPPPMAWYPTPTRWADILVPAPAPTLNTGYQIFHVDPVGPKYQRASTELYEKQTQWYAGYNDGTAFMMRLLGRGHEL